MGYKIKRQDSSPYYLILHRGNPVEDVKRYLSTLNTLAFSKNTIRTYCYDLLELYRWLNVYEKDLKDLRRSDLYKYIDYQKLKNNSSVTINRRLVVCNAFYKYLFEEDIQRDSCSIESTPFYRGSKSLVHEMIHFKKRLIKNIRVRNPRKIIEKLSRHEIKKFLESFSKYRDTAIILMMLSCGLRSKEVIELESNNINMVEGRLKILGKGNKERVVPLPELLISTLKKYIELERPKKSQSSKLFVILKGSKKGQALTSEGLRRLFRYHRNITNLKNANPHKFRHTFGSEMVNEGMPLPVLQKLMGHESIDMTMKYVHLTDKDLIEHYHRVIKKIEDKNNV